MTNDLSPKIGSEIVKVAFATTDGVNVDEHFGRSGLFAVYEISARGYELVENRKFAEGKDKAVEDTKGNEVEHDNIMRNKVDRLSDCKIIFFTNIGSPSAARLVNKGLMPVKVKKVGPIENELEKLMDTINASPPPWLKKILNGK